MMAGTDAYEDLRNQLERGDAFLERGIEHAAEAIQCFEAVIAGLTRTASDSSAESIHLAGRAWMNRGRAWMLYDSAEGIAQAIDSLLEAEAYLLQLVSGSEELYLQDAGTLYACLAQAYFRLGRSDTLSVVVGYYDQANSILKRLPWQDDERYRYELAALWLNRGNLYWASNVVLPRDEAVRCFRLAVEYGIGLSTELPEHVWLMAKLWTNYGNVLKDASCEKDHAEAIECFIQAAHLLKTHAGGSPSVPFELAAVLANLANLRADKIQTERDFKQVLDGGRESLAHTSGQERSQLLAAQISVQARRAICQAYDTWLKLANHRMDVQHDREILDFVDASLALIRFWEHRNAHYICPMAHCFFRLGESVYRRVSPGRLSQFVLQNLDPDQSDGALFRDPEIVQIGIDALKTAMGAASDPSILESYQGGLERLKQIQQLAQPTSPDTSGSVKSS